MDGHARQHDPDQIVPSETGLETGVADAVRQAHDEPETERPHPLMPAPPAPPARPGFWGSLTEAERNDLLAYADQVVYPVGTVLWFEGQTADQAVVIQSGSIRVSVTRGGLERIIAFRGPGDIVGERAALLLRRRSATIVAMDTVHGLRMTTQQFATYLSDHPRVVAVMEREVYDRLTEQTGLTPQPQAQPLAQPQAQPQVQPLAQPQPQARLQAPSQYTTTDQYWPSAPHDPAVQYGSTPQHSPAPQYGLAEPPVARSEPGAQYSVQPHATGPTPLPPADHVQHGTANGGSSYIVPAPGSAPWPVQAPVQSAQPMRSPVQPVPTTHVPAPSPAPFEDEPTQPMTITPHGRSGTTWAGQNCTIVYTDIAGFSETHRNDRDRLDMRRTMYALLREAFGESAVPWDACHIEDRGDGALIVVPPEVPTAAVIDPMIASLAARLRRHNQRSSGAVRIQLRVAVHVGPVMPDPPGVAGWALIRTARLLDARPLKDRLAATGADLGFIASTFVYESVIAHSPGYVDAAEYEPISCKVKKLKTEGWIHLRGVPAQSAV